MRYISKRLKKLENSLRYKIKMLGNVLECKKWWENEKGYVPDNIQDIVEFRKKEISDISEEIKRLKEIETISDKKIIDYDKK